MKQPAFPMARSLSRRDFLRTNSVFWASVAIVPASVARAAERMTPGSKPALAGVGVGGVGFGQLQECEKAGFHIAALCDVDDAYAQKAFDRWPQARRYRDFREMLSAEGDKIDAVHVGTPDHTHALITVAALRRNKHVCCVKPLTRTVQECRTVVSIALKSRVATQVTASPNTDETSCRICELIWAGAVGLVREVHAWSTRPLWPQGMIRPPGQDPVPRTLDWKLWLGPAPERAFKDKWPDGHYALAQLKSSPEWIAQYRGVYHPFNFRGWWDFGTGALGDMGCHHFNTVLRALKLSAPRYIEAAATKVLPETPPLASVVTYEYPARGDQPAVRLFWHDGGLRPPHPVELVDRPMPEEGTLYVGDEGKILITWQGWDLLPAARKAKFSDVPRTLPRRSGTWGEWFDACRGGETAGCNFDWAQSLTDIVLLGNIALRTGKRLEWDATQNRFVNSDNANRLLDEPYHNGWSLDQV
jgi:hypothetical protein